MIKIDSLDFSYDKENKIISDFSDEFKKGERICLRSPSGTGKTTLLRLIAGLEKADSGSIKMDKNLKISFCFQQEDLFPWYTALKNVSLVSDENTAKKMLSLFGLDGSFNKLPDELSGGMKRRVSLARAISAKPDILLIDEGFVGIEKELQKTVMDYLISISKDILIVFATHDDYVSDYLATRVINI